MPDSILIVGAGQNQISIIRKAKEMGFCVAAVDGSPDAPGLALADKPFVADIRRFEKLLPIADVLRPSAIYPAAEHAVEACAQLTSRLKLPGVPPEVAHRVRNKFAMREALASAGRFNPRYAKTANLEEAKTIARVIGFPLIVKPVDGNASRGVRKVENIEQLDECFGYAANASGDGDVLLESLLPGIEYNVDGLVYQGRYYPGAVTGKIPSPPPYRYDEAIFIPGTSEEEENFVFSAVADALACIGFDTGTTHVEVMVSNGAVSIVEMAGRPGGGRIPSDLIPLAYGTDYLADSIRISAGLPPTSRRLFKKASVLHWIKAKPGKLVKIVGIETALSMPGVVEVNLSAKQGTEIPQVVDCVTRDKIGYVITTGDTLEQAMERARTAASEIHLETWPCCDT